MMAATRGGGRDWGGAGMVKRPGRRVLGRVVGALLAVAGLLGGPAGAEEPKVEFKLSHWLPPAHPLQQAIADWAASLKADSGGTLTAVIFPAEQLGKAFDHYDMARDGIADAAFVNPGY